MHLQIDLTPSLIVSRLTNFTLRAAQPPGSFFTVPEHVLVDNYTVYKSLRLVKPNKSSSLDPVPGTVWKGSLLNFHLLSWTSTTRRCCKVMCPNPSNSRMLSRCQKALRQNLWSRIYLKFHKCPVLATRSLLSFFILSSTLLRGVEVWKSLTNSG